MGELARWNVLVSKETDDSVRSYLTAYGGGPAGLSELVERAVRRELVRATVRDIQDRHAALPAQELQARIDQACAETRTAFWKDRTWWSD